MTYLPKHTPERFRTHLLLMGLAMLQHSQLYIHSKPFACV